MNPYHEMIEMLGPEEGFKGRLSKGVLSYKPKSRRVYRPKTALRTLILIILFALACAVTASAAYVVLNWDPIFVKNFSPTESQVSQLENALGSDAVVSQCGDVTLKVRQTLGDDKTLYVILDIELPPSVPLRELLGAGTSDALDLHIIPNRLWFGSATLTYEDVMGKSIDDYRDVDKLLGTFEGGWTVKQDSVDFETNTLTYLLCCSPQSETLSGKPLTILIDRLVESSKTPFETIIEGPFVISWTPESTAASRTYEITEGGRTNGWVTISPFALKGELYTSDYKSLDDMLHSVSLTFTCGETYLPEHQGCGGSHSSPSGNVSFDIPFVDILLLDDVTAIHMGGYTIDVS